MRTPVAIVFAAVLSTMFWKAGDSVRASGHPNHAPAVFDPDPAHIWNRLYAALLVRENSHGVQYGEDSLDPPLWFESEHLLAQPSHSHALRVLDAFLQSHAENLIRDPVKRAVMQRSLWAVFDWSVQQESASGRPPYNTEKRELQARLAEVMRRIALSPKEVESLPDTYAQAVASGAFAKEYDPDRPKRVFLPPDLFDPHGPWVYLDASPEVFRSGGVAQMHVEELSGRSRFLVFVRLPGGRKATMDYLSALWNFPQPWIQSDVDAVQAHPNPELPSFPAGTEVALVRQLNLFDDQGHLLATPITESAQFRVYHAITNTPARFFEADWAQVIKKSGQDFYEIKLSHPLLFAGEDGGLKATGRDERELSPFQGKGDDEIEAMAAHPEFEKMRLPALQTCVSCHSGGGLRSLNSLEKLLKPNRRQQETSAHDAFNGRYWLDDGTEAWKQERYDWGLLNGYWKAGASPQ